MILVSLAAFIHDGKLFMQKRKEEGHLDGKLELPGGKIEAGESPQVAISREVQEELGVKISADNFQLFKIYPFEYSDRKVQLYVHICRSNVDTKAGSWHKISQDFINQNKQNWPAANVAILLDLLDFIDE